MRTAPLVLFFSLVAVLSLHPQEATLYEEILSRRGVTNQRIREAFLSVPRTPFIDEGMERYLDKDSEIPLAEGGFLIKPSMALSCLLYLSPQPGDRCLVAGGNTGYMASLLASICEDVSVIEESPERIEASGGMIRSYASGSVSLSLKDDIAGVLESGNFDIIMLAGATETVPAVLLEHLSSGGTLLAPLEEPGGFQILILVTRTGDGSYRIRALRDCFFPDFGDPVP